MLLYMIKKKVVFLLMQWVTGGTFIASHLKKEKKTFFFFYVTFNINISNGIDISGYFKNIRLVVNLSIIREFTSYDNSLENKFTFF